MSSGLHPNQSRVSENLRSGVELVRGAQLLLQVRLFASSHRHIRARQTAQSSAIRLGSRRLEPIQPDEKLDEPILDRNQASQRVALVRLQERPDTVQVGRGDLVALARRRSDLVLAGIVRG